MRHRFLLGDAAARLRGLETASVDCCITSPPYWQVRDYGVPGQIGQETTVQEWLDRLLEVFREVRRVLKPTGSLWLNVGDHYADKRLLLLPARLALSLMEQGWILRNDIILRKTNPCPEAVQDRVRSTYEHVFHFVLSRRYTYDLDALRQPPKIPPRFPAGIPPYGTPEYAHWYEHVRPRRAWYDHRHDESQGRMQRKRVPRLVHPKGGVLGDVWEFTIRPHSRREQHFAAFPEELVRRCLLASTRRGGWVLDPFGGSGTVSRVAEQHGRNSLYIDLKSAYLEAALRSMPPEAQCEADKLPVIGKELSQTCPARKPEPEMSGRSVPHVLV